MPPIFLDVLLGGIGLPLAGVLEVGLPVSTASLGSALLLPLALYPWGISNNDDVLIPWTLRLSSFSPFFFLALNSLLPVHCRGFFFSNILAEEDPPRDPAPSRTLASSVEQSCFPWQATHIIPLNPTFFFFTPVPLAISNASTRSIMSGVTL
eukprot:CAMPEP_0172538920 /NCGR_PEP_ID=MMETSP1067-20121228/10217_1 /TAXON_ID=265564 ORGANISM="Thalassiosira punctigera, Strain Tpunct2005C2" /NCGR_SAMPLE_ID=MMETSP1067 /ASSEMBLY_ACC=CAM_ASM_000444 /LENGTH=151 /DNA_ID=CAMNT_0013324513 /DNA_START=362 /DNA_END=813 /DNA_ORIENTATION=-